MFIKFVFIPLTQQRIPGISFITATVSSSCGNTPKAECHRCYNNVTLRHSSNVLVDEADSDWNDEDLNEYRPIVQYSISSSRAANS